MIPIGIPPGIASVIASSSFRNSFTILIRNLSYNSSIHFSRDQNSFEITPFSSTIPANLPSRTPSRIPFKVLFQRFFNPSNNLNSIWIVIFFVMVLIKHGVYNILQQFCSRRSCFDILLPSNQNTLNVFNKSFAFTSVIGLYPQKSRSITLYYNSKTSPKSLVYLTNASISHSLSFEFLSFDLYTSCQNFLKKSFNKYSKQSLDEFPKIQGIFKTFIHEILPEILLWILL